MSFTTTPLLAEPALSPTAGGPGFRKRNARVPLPGSGGARGRDSGWPGPISSCWGFHAPRLSGDTEGLESGSLSSRDRSPEAPSPLRRGLPQSETSIPFREQTPELTDAGVPRLPLTRSLQLPGPELGPPQSVGSEPGARARSRRSRGCRRLLPGRPFLQRAGPGQPSGQRGPSPGRAGRGGAGRGAELSAPTRPGPLLPRSSPTPHLSERLEVWAPQVFRGSQLREM